MKTVLILKNKSLSKQIFVSSLESVWAQVVLEP